MPPYRDATEFIRVQADAVHARRRAELRATPTGWHSVYVQRCARLATGAVAIVGAMALAGMVATVPRCAPDTGGPVVIGLALVWSAALGAGAIGALVAAGRLRGRLRRGLARTDDPLHDLMRLTATGPAAIERELASRRARASWIVPLAAATLLMPHTLHAIVGWLLWQQPLDAGYVQLSTGFAAPCFGYGLYVAWDFPRRPRVADAVVGAAVVGLFPLLHLSALIALGTAAPIALVAHRPMRAVVARERALGLG